MEEEREEERERQEMKRRNYQLVVERAGLRRRGSNDSVEDQVKIVETYLIDKIVEVMRMVNTSLDNAYVILMIELI